MYISSIEIIIYNGQCNFFRLLSVLLYRRRYKINQNKIKIKLLRGNVIFIYFGTEQRRPGQAIKRTAHGTPLNTEGRRYGGATQLIARAAAQSDVTTGRQAASQPASPSVSHPVSCPAHTSPRSSLTYRHVAPRPAALTAVVAAALRWV